MLTTTEGLGAEEEADTSWLVVATNFADLAAHEADAMSVDFKL
jgi:hypothetical protein